METTLNVEGLSEDRIEYLKNLIELWRKQEAGEQATDGPKPIIKRKVSPDEFIVKNSGVKGGQVTRAMAYED